MWSVFSTSWYTVCSFKEFVTSGSSNNDTGKVFGSLETKYKYADYGKQTTRAPNSRPRKPSYDSDKI